MIETDDPWGEVSRIAQTYIARTPGNATALIELEMFDGERFKPAVLQRRPPWVVIEIGQADDPTAVDREILVLREDDVRRVHMWRESGAKQPVGFRLGEIEG